MTIKTRRKIFYTLVVLFILIGGIIVFYAQGWRFDFSTGHFEKIGGVYIRSSPQDAAIFVNGKPVRNQSGFLDPGTLISDLLPQTYRITLKAPGYVDWQENTTVQPTLVQQFKNAVLVPANGAPASSTYVANVIENVSPINGVAIRSTGNSTSTNRATSGISPFNTSIRIVVNKNVISTFDIAHNTTTASTSIAGKNNSILWIMNSLAGIVQNDGQFYLYTTNGALQKIADDVKTFAATVDASLLAALEPKSLEVLSPTDPTIYYRFNLPDMASAQSVIWYRDRTHLFVVYPDHVSFLDLQDASLTNFTTIGYGTDPVYDAQQNVLYIKNTAGKFLQYHFSL
jgi:hypothetical protein